MNAAATAVASSVNTNGWRLNPNNLISVTLTPSTNAGSIVNNNNTITSSSNHQTTNTNNNHHNHHTNKSSSSTSQKHGAERLFAYLEADGSDPEDYNRYFVY